MLGKEILETVYALGDRNSLKTNFVLDHKYKSSALLDKME